MGKHWSQNAVTVLVLAPVACEQGFDFADHEADSLTSTFLLFPATCLSEIERACRIGVIRAGSRVRLLPDHMPYETYGGSEYGWEYDVEFP